MSVRPLTARMRYALMRLAEDVGSPSGQRILKAHPKSRVTFRALERRGLVDHLGGDIFIATDEGLVFGAALRMAEATS